MLYTMVVSYHTSRHGGEREETGVMQFNSAQFLIFFPIAVCGYYLLPDKLKNKWLLLLSYYFYMCWNAVYALLIFFSTASTWLCGFFVGEKRRGEAVRKAALTVSILINLAILFVFKYYGMFAGSLASVLAKLGVLWTPPTLSLLLPVGISFYTFQALGYALDVYRGTVQHEKNFFDYALFISFFPQLVAGPIERSKNLLPQFHRVNRFRYENFAQGMRLMLLGFCKKILIADHLSVVIDKYYLDLEKWPGPLLVLGIVLFAVQIYCDFSAYTDIARGAARVLGFELMQNFDHPYFSRSISEFWRRWHISLSSWFEDYIFTPFVWSNPLRRLGPRFEQPPMRTGLLLVFLVSGFWHGADWTFVAWGLCHAVFRIIEASTARSRKKFYKKHHIDKNAPLPAALQLCGTFALVCVGYVFFRSETFAQAWYIFAHSVRGWGMLLQPAGLLDGLITLFGSVRVLLITSVSSLALLVMELLEVRHSCRFEQLLDRLPAAGRWAVCYGLLFALAAFGCFEASSFIYFQF